MLGMDDVIEVRRRVARGESYRSVAKALGISRNTVRRCIEGASPGEHKPVERERPKLEAVQQRMDELLDASGEWTGGKQRLTAAQLHRMLEDEGREVGHTLVRAYVAEWRRRRQEVFVPLCYRPGDLGEVDFFEVQVDVVGERRRAWMFLMRLMHSGRDFAWLYPRQDQVAFLDGHVRAFAHLGAVPQRVLYDNLRAAVRRVLVGSERLLSARFAALCAHYHGFEPCFARPATGHDKGGVEARGRGIRLAELVPIPSGDDLGQLSSLLLARLDRRVDAARWCEEAAHMLPLPAAPFVAARRVERPASRRALVQVEGGSYSVPERWAGLVITAYVGVDEVTLVGPDGEVRRRRVGFGRREVDYRDYLETLSRKPQAVRQVIDELLGDLGAPFDRVWRRLVDERGPKQGARVFARILAAIHERGLADVAAMLEAALGRDEPLSVALRPPPEPVVPLPDEHVPASLRDVVVESARAADFDALLAGGE
jgi:transposase